MAKKKGAEAEATTEKEKGAPPATGSRPPPAYLSDNAKVVWHEIIGEFMQAKILIKAGEDVVALYCNDVAIVRECMKTLAADGMFYDCKTKTGDTMKRAHPAFGIMRDAQGRVLKAADAMGITPKAARGFDESTQGDLFGFRQEPGGPKNANNGDGDGDTPATGGDEWGDLADDIAGHATTH